MALRDALLAVQRPFIEVHLSDPATREPFRQVNFLHDIALESIVGQGARGYHLALESIARRRRPGGERWLTDRVETAELRRLRRRIDALDRRIVALLNERAELAREAGRAKTAAGRRAIRDAEREREVLLRVSMANTGPLPQADLLALYRRLMAATRALEARDRDRAASGRHRRRPTPAPEPRRWSPARPAAPSTRTRFAPAPTGYLHLGHVANAI